MPLYIENVLHSNCINIFERTICVLEGVVHVIAIHVAEKALLNESEHCIRLFGGKDVRKCLEKPGILLR